MADAGVASRRRCEEMIVEGMVEVNGEPIARLPAFVDPASDRIVVNGRVIPKPERSIYIMLYKPGRTVTTVSEENEFGGEGMSRRTVMDLVDHPSSARLFPVGRLDFDTRGLVLLTNDGELANRLTHPRYGVHKTYQAVVRGRVADETIERLRKGLYLTDRREGKTVGASRTAQADLQIARRDRERTILEMTLREGRNRQVRRMLAIVGHPVKKLTRVAMGPVRLKGLAVGEWRELDRRELAALKKASRGYDVKTVPSDGGRGSGDAGGGRRRRRGAGGAGPRDG